MKLLQLNIYRGKYIAPVIDFVKKNDIDILIFQEVSGGAISFNRKDDFAYLKHVLSYEGVLTITMSLRHDTRSYFGNATLFKPSFHLKDTDVLWLEKYRETISYHNNDFTRIPRNALFVSLEKDGRIINTINTHFAWSVPPVDTEYKEKMGRSLLSFAKSQKGLSVLSGDFNLPLDSQIIQSFKEFGANLVEKNEITNTLNPHVHRAEHLFPEGLAVDFVFVNEKIKVEKFSVVDRPDLSDHLGLLLEFTV